MSAHPSAGSCRAFMVVCALLLCGFSHAAEKIFLPAGPTTAAAESTPTFRFDADAFVRVNQRAATAGVIDGLPIPGFTDRSFRVVTPIDSLSGSGIEMEIVEDGGSRFVDLPTIHQLVAESESHPGDRVRLYEIDGRFFGTALVGGMLHELTPGDGADEYRFLLLDSTSGPAPGWCATESTPESSAAQVAAEAAAGETYTRPVGVRSIAVADREAEIAIECSYDYVSKFTSVEAATHHILAILAEVNNIYIRDIQLQFRLTHLRMWNTPADPYDGASSFDYLADFFAVLQNPASPAALRNSDVAHVFTADLNFGGVAIENGICSPIALQGGFSDVTSSNTYPFTGYSWSVDVVAHEIGHTLGSPHTHCYTPPVDMCWGGGTPPCYPGSFIPMEGTILSYCHIGSYSRLEFHPRVITVLRVAALNAACLAVVPTAQSDIYEDDNTPEAASPLSEQLDQTHSIFPVGDVDWLTLNLTHWAGVTLSTSGASGDTVMTLYGPTMSELATSDDIDGGNLFSRIELGCDGIPLAPGRYYLRIEEKGNDATIPSYQVSIEADYCFGDQYEPDDTLLEGTLVQLGTVQDHSNLPEGDGDCYRLTLAAPTNFVIRVEGPSFVWRQMHFYDSSFNQIDVGIGDGTSCVLSRDCSSSPTPAGTYYLRVVMAGNRTSGNYKIRFYPCTPKVDVESSGTPLADGGGPVDFGSVQPGFAPISRTFRVTNHGVQPLSTSGLSVPASYVVAEGLSATIPSGGNDTFTIDLPTSSVGVFAGTVSFVTNDASVGTFDFSISGEVVNEAPEVAVVEGTTSITSGVTTVDFGRNTVGATAPSRTFVVRNLGALPLATAGLSVPAPFVITEPLDATIPGSSSAAETVSLAPAVTFGGVPNILVPATFSSPGQVSEVTVKVDVTTPWTASLTLYLRHPDGSVVLLISNQGGTGDNLSDTTFADLAATPITAGTPPFTGTFRPQSPLSAFNGKNIAGTWSLIISDPFFSPTEPRLLNNLTITVRSASTGQDSFTVQLPTSVPADANELVTFSTNDSDEGLFSIPVTGFVGEVPAFASFTVAGGVTAQSANPVPFTFVEGGSFPATSIEVSESSDFAAFQSSSVPGGPYEYAFASNAPGTRTLHARLRNATGVSATRSATTILDNHPPIAVIQPAYENRVGGTSINFNSYQATDSHSGIQEIDVWVKPPGGAWQYAFTQTTPSGNFSFSPSHGAGLYLLDVVARDFAGNTSPPPSTTNLKRMIAYNPVENGPFPMHFPTPLAGAVSFPMEPSNQVYITFAEAPSTGVVTVQRFETNSNAAGLDTNSLIGQSWSITGSGGFTFTSAEIEFGFDAALLNGLDESTDLTRAYRVDGSTFTTYSGTVNTFLHRFTVSGVTGFSDWFVGEPMPSTGVGEDWMMY